MLKLNNRSIFWLAVIACSYFQEGSSHISIKCWECRSEFDVKCLDPFDNTTIAITDCQFSLNTLKGNKADMACLKIYQYEKGQTNLIRRCGFTNETESTEHGTEQLNCLRKPCNPVDCPDRVCSDDCYADYCWCNEKDGCNSSTNLKMSRVTWFLLFVFLFFVRI